MVQLAETATQVGRRGRAAFRVVLAGRSTATSRIVTDLVHLTGRQVSVPAFGFVRVAEFGSVAEEPVVAIRTGRTLDIISRIHME